MRDIFKAEWLRYRLWILIYAVSHLLVLAFFTRLVDLGQQPLNVHRVFGGVYALTGILLGLHQMGTWRRPNQWINLLHRPVTPRRIAIGLLGAGALALTVAIVLPIVVIVAGQVWGTARVVELRHVILPVAALLIALCGYFAGAYGLLADRRYSASGGVLLIWIAAANASGSVALVVQVLACAWLFVVVLIAFRPDLGEAPRSVPATVLTALPVQMAIYLLLILVGFIGELFWVMQGSHPTNSSTPPQGGYVETERMSGRDRMIAGLTEATAADASLWREQITLSEVHDLDRQVRGIATRGEMSNTMPTEFDDSDARVRWTFSHDRMRFEGTSLADGRRVGELGMGKDNAAFDATASQTGVLPGIGKNDATVIAGNTLYQYQSATRRAVPRVRLPPGEWLLGTTPIGGSLAVLGDKALYLFDGRHLVDGVTPVAPRYRVPIPGAMGDLARAEIVELVDGYLVSFTFSWRAYDMRGAAPYQTTLWVNDAGQVMPVATRALHQDFPTFYRYRAWWVSPAMFTVREVAMNLFATDGPLDANATPPVPDGMRALAAALALLSLCIGGWIAWGRESSMSARIVWTLACGLIGIPALVSLVLIVPRRESVASDAVHAIPAT